MLSVPVCSLKKPNKTTHHHTRLLFPRSTRRYTLRKNPKHFQRQRSQTIFIDGHMRSRLASCRNKAWSLCRTRSRISEATVHRTQVRFSLVAFQDLTLTSPHSASTVPHCTSLCGITPAPTRRAGSIPLCKVIFTYHSLRYKEETQSLIQPISQGTLPHASHHHHVTLGLPIRAPARQLRRAGLPCALHKWQTRGVFHARCPKVVQLTFT